MTHAADVELSPQGDEPMRRALSLPRRAVLLQWLDAADPYVRRDQLEAARRAVLDEAPHAYALCADVRGALAFAGGDVAVREALGYFDHEDDRWSELREALLDLGDVSEAAGHDDQGRSHTWDGAHIFWERQLTGYVHAVDVAGLDREALLELTRRARFIGAGLRRCQRAPAAPCRSRARRRAAMAPARRRVLTTPAPCNAPPAHRVGSREVTPAVGLLVMAQTCAAGAGHRRPTTHGPP